MFMVTMESLKTLLFRLWDFRYMCLERTTNGSNDQLATQNFWHREEPLHAQSCPIHIKKTVDDFGRYNPVKACSCGIFVYDYLISRPLPLYAQERIAQVVCKGQKKGAP